MSAPRSGGSASSCSMRRRTGSASDGAFASCRAIHSSSSSDSRRRSAVGRCRPTAVPRLPLICTSPRPGTRLCPQRSRPSAYATALAILWDLVTLRTGQDPRRPMRARDRRAARSPDRTENVAGHSTQDPLLTGGAPAEWSAPVRLCGRGRPAGEAAALARTGAVRRAWAAAWVPISGADRWRR
jgi:hypothetical protein